MFKLIAPRDLGPGPCRRCYGVLGLGHLRLDREDRPRRPRRYVRSLLALEAMAERLLC